jgi:hypothetical protein
MSYHQMIKASKFTIKQRLYLKLNIYHDPCPYRKLMGIFLNKCFISKLKLYHKPGPYYKLAILDLSMIYGLFSQ